MSLTTIEDNSLIYQVIPGRMTLLITVFLVLINIFNTIQTNSPKVVQQKDILQSALTWYIFTGGRSHCYRGLAHRLHRVCVCSPDWVHGHPPQNENQEAHWSQTEERQLCSDRFSIFRSFSNLVCHLQPHLLVINMVEQNERTADV